MHKLLLHFSWGTVDKGRKKNEQTDMRMFCFNISIRRLTFSLFLFYSLCRFTHKIRHLYHKFMSQRTKSNCENEFVLHMWRVTEIIFECVRMCLDKNNFESRPNNAENIKVHSFSSTGKMAMHKIMPIQYQKMKKFTKYAPFKCKICF